MRTLSSVRVSWVLLALASTALAACGDDDGDGGFMFTDGGADSTARDTGPADDGSLDGATDPDAGDGGTMRDSGAPDASTPDVGRPEGAMPPTLEVSFEPATVCSGSDVTVRWTTTGANRVELLQSTGRLIVAILDRGEVTMGEFPTPVPEGGVIRVRALGPGGMTEERLEVMVSPGAAIGELTATPTTLGTSGMTTVSWTTSNAASIELTAAPGGPVTVPAGMIASGSVAVRVTESTVFTLRATGSCGERATASVRVTVYTSPPDVTFTIENSSLPMPVAGASVSLPWRNRARLRWNVLDAESVSVSGFDGYFEDGIVGTFEDISSTGTIADANGDDDLSGMVPIGFSFPLYGMPIDEVAISTNGWIASSVSTGSPYSASFPYSGLPDGIVAVLWDDLSCDPGLIRFQTLGTAPNRRFVVQWTGVETLGGDGPLTFQIVLFEGGRIELRYRDLAADIDGSGQGVGIESPDGTRAFELVNGEPGRLASGSGFGLRPGSAPMGEVEFAPTGDGTATLVATNPMGSTMRTVTWTVMAPADTGCGPGVTTVTLPAPDAMGHVRYSGNTAMGGSMEIADLPTCGGTNTGPEVAHLLTLPYDADLVAWHDSTSADLVVAVRRECRSASSEVDCADSEGTGFGEVALNDLRRGDVIGIVVDAYSSASGAYSLDVQLRRRLDPGATCTPSDLCGGGTECIGGTCAMVPEITETSDFGAIAMATAVPGRTRVRGTLSATDQDCFRISAPVGGSLDVGLRTGPGACSADLTGFVIPPPPGDIATIEGDRRDPYCDWEHVPAAAGGELIVCVSSRSGAVLDPSYYLVDLIPSTLP